MKKNLYLTILTIVTVICIIAGSCYHIVGWGVSFLSHLPFVSSSEKESAGQVIDKNRIDLDAFDTIDVDTDVAELNLVSGDTYSISISANKKLVPEYKVSDGTLTIKHTAHVRNLIGSKKCKITVTVPEALDKIDISSDVGDVTLTDIEANEVTLTADVGDLNIDSCDFESVTIDANVGDADLQDIVFTNMEITSDVGDVDISAGDLNGYEIDLKTDVGDVDVNDRDYHKNYYSEGTGTGRLSVSNNTGDIELDMH
ncbi:MAG: DUF4097 family beta strand repeat-containing protein [Lachnospiraceae bacterium]|nr:DUF4097 family beta strand repeat-containing protein [Lachnospiraceae bacterium]